MIADSLLQLAALEQPTHPFPGLRPFEFHENHLFFGRDGQSEQVIAKLGGTRFVAVGRHIGQRQVLAGTCRIFTRALRRVDGSCGFQLESHDHAPRQ